MSSNKSMLNQGIDILVKNKNNRLFNHYSLIAKSRFTWNNLPNGIESRHIEKALFEHGQVAFFDDEVLGNICLPCSPCSNLNVYGDPTSYLITGLSYSKNIDSEKIVRILSNDNATPTLHTVNYYSNLINELEKTSNINMLQQKFPYIISTTTDNKLSMKNIFKQVDEGELAIYVDSKFSNGGDVGIKAIKTDAPYLLDKLQQHKQDLECELFTILGINNSKGESKERLLVDQINVNNGHVLMNLELEYKNRLIACEQINKKFNLNITVEKTIENLEVDFIGKTKKKEVM